MMSVNCEVFNSHGWILKVFALISSGITLRQCKSCNSINHSFGIKCLPTYIITNRLPNANLIGIVIRNEKCNNLYLLRSTRSVLFDFSGVTTN